MKQLRGFTLVELSISLVIIGLVIGGILMGQSLIRSSELRSVITQYQKLLAAENNFRDKYQGIAGDITNGAYYFGAADGVDGSQSSCKTTSSTTLTCNGDGNNQVDVSSTSEEPFRFWQQLTAAGLLEGAYDGTHHGSSTKSATTANAPSSRLTNSLWYATWIGALSGSSKGFDGQYDNGFEFGTVTANSDPVTAIFKPEDAFTLDAKMDDGLPAMGKVVALVTSGNLSACTSTSSSSTLTATYLVSSSTIACALYFRQQF